MPGGDFYNLVNEKCFKCVMYSEGFMLHGKNEKSGGIRGDEYKNPNTLKYHEFIYCTMTCKFDRDKKAEQSYKYLKSQFHDIVRTQHHILRVLHFYILYIFVQTFVAVRSTPITEIKHLLMLLYILAEDNEDREKRQFSL